MALSAKVGHFNIGLGAAASTVAITGVGFLPKAIVFWWSGRTESTDTAGNATHLRGVGWTTGPANNVSKCTRSVHGSASLAIADVSHRDDACITEAGDGALIGWADLQSFDADGFTLEILDAFVTDLRVSYLALGGDTLTNATTGVIAGPAATGNEAYTGVGFQPDFLLLSGIKTTGAPPAFSADSDLTIGMVSGPSNQFCYTGGSNDAATTTQTAAYSNDLEMAGHVAPAINAMSNRAEFVSFDADGVTLNWLEAGSLGRSHYYLALKLGGNIQVGTVLTQTDTVTPIAVSSLGFTPRAVLFVSHTLAESTQDVVQDHDTWSMGAATGTAARVAQGIRDQDAAATTVITTAIETDAVYVKVDGSGVVGLMDLTEMGADGFTCLMDDADPAQALVGYAVFGESAGGTPTTTDAHLGMPRAARRVVPRSEPTNLLNTGILTSPPPFFTTIDAKRVK